MSKPALAVVNPCAAGIDVGDASHYVCVGDDPEADVRKFGTFTGDLVRLADFLEERGIRTVALEATGVYWIPLFELLERRGFEAVLVDPRQTKTRKGRPKTDVQDCQWIRRLHACGLLAGSFRAPDAVLALRSYVRQRGLLVREGARGIQRMQKALQQMNVKLTLVVSDVAGKTGLRIIEAILAGERDPAALAALRDRQIRASAETVAAALQGNWRDEHLFALRQAHEEWRFRQGQLDTLDAKIEAELVRLAGAAPKRPAKAKAEGEGGVAATAPAPPKKRHTKRNALRFDGRQLAAQWAGVDLTAIAGLDVLTVLVVLSECGPDLSRFPSERHFGSWLGLAPCPDRSGTSRNRNRARVGCNRAGQALRVAAMAAGRSQTALGCFHRRIAATRGAAKAVTATAYKLARLCYRCLKHGLDYVQAGVEAYEKRYRERTIRTLSQKALQLGYYVELKPIPAGF